MANRAIALIASSVPSSWVSCTVITPNLLKAYQLAFRDRVSIYSYVENMSAADVWTTAEKIYQARPAKIVFLDHAPHPERLLRTLKTFYRGCPLPPIFVHVYGDFTLTTGRWRKVESLLKGVPVHFIAASPRQSELLRRFMAEPACVTEACPFPVDMKTFSFQVGLRERARAKYGISSDEFVFVYTGRMSLQKNVTTLLLEVAAFQSRYPRRRVRLLIAGAFDSLAAPFFGMNHRRGSYFQYWSETLEGLSSEFASRVSYLGQLGPSELTELYHAADCFVSLSLHHDEDFGMSAAEALSCGTPVILSDWGGFSGFAENQKVDVNLVSVKITDKGLAFLQGAFQESSQAVSSLPASQDERMKRSKRAQAWVSISAVAQQIQKIHRRTAPRFAGFSWLLREHEAAMKRKVPFSEGPRKNTFYEVVYGAYTAG
jgi:glycosyltransferase involved in cell wall biosynthesis